MARRGMIWTVGSLLVLGAALSCSSDDEGSGDDDDNDDDSTQVDPNSEFRDTDGDGQPDPLTASDFGEAGMAVTEDELTAWRNESCTGQSVEPEPLGATLFLVLDASSSMDAEAAGTGNQSKWEATRDAMIDAIGDLDDSTAVGLLGYPNKVVDRVPGSTDSCVNVDALISLNLLGSGDHRQTIIDGLNAIETETCTPTHDAYTVARADFAATPAAGQKYLLLMTDGQPTYTLNCQGPPDNPEGCGSGVDTPQGTFPSEEAIIAEITAAYQEDNIKTFILGSPGSEQHMETGLDNRWWLSEAARAGGTAISTTCSDDGPNYCHFDMTQSPDFSAALRETLGNIVGQVLACDYEVPLPPEGETVDYNQTSMVIWPGGANPIQILPADGPDCEQGWYVDSSTDPARVLLCSQTCEVAQSDPQARIELLFGCDEPIMVPE
jgi:hypothetical protein